MRVDVVDLVAGSHAGLFQRRLHHAHPAVAVLRWRGDVIRVGAHAVADELGVDAARRAAWRTPAPRG